MELSSILRSPIPDMIYAYHEKCQGDWHRSHLGASVIGAPCGRAIWYGFRWTVAPVFGGRMLRLFQTGHMAEGRIFTELKNIGIKVHSEQKSVTIALHFSGSIDGLGEGFPESKDTHLLEVKTHNQKSWDTLNKDGVAIAKPQHYCQMQCYMGGLGLKRAYYLAINKNTDEIYAERVRFELGEYDALKDRARQVINTPIPLAKIADNPARFECRFCDYKLLCHTKAKPEVNCRTCAHSTPCSDGYWRCARDNGTIDFHAQITGCQDHLFIPALLNMEVMQAGSDYVEYESGWINKNNSREYKP